MISMNLAINYHFETLYIDTHLKFSAIRLRKMLESRNCYTKTEIFSHLNRIKYKQCYNVEDFLNILHLLADNNENTKNIKFIVVDSLPSIWLTYQGSCIQTGEIHLHLI